MKPENIIPALLYFLLVGVLLVLVVLHVFQLLPLETGSFTKYMVSLLVVVLLLPSVQRVKIFSLVEATRKSRMFQKK